jgi:hypothetical protein
MVCRIQMYCFYEARFLLQSGVCNAETRLGHDSSDAYSGLQHILSYQCLQQQEV